MRQEFAERELLKMAGVAFQIGKSWYTPGGFRKSGKQRAYRIRNLEECVANRKQGIYKSRFLHEKVRRKTIMEGEGHATRQFS